MDSRELTPEQLQRIQEAIAPCRKFLLHLMLRTEEVFKPSDELYIAAHEAQAAIQSLFVTVHYLSCRQGVGKPTTMGLGTSQPIARKEVDANRR